MLALCENMQVPCFSWAQPSSFSLHFINVHTSPHLCCSANRNKNERTHIPTNINKQREKNLRGLKIINSPTYTGASQSLSLIKILLIVSWQVKNNTHSIHKNQLDTWIEVGNILKMFINSKDSWTKSSTVNFKIRKCSFELHWSIALS